MSWLQLGLLASLLACIDSRQNDPHRWREEDPWGVRSNQHGFGSVQGQPRRYLGVSGESRQVSPQNPVSVQCHEDRLVVSVQRDLYGTGVLVRPTDLTLGSELCAPSSESTETTLIFKYGLQDCGSTLQMTPDWVIYSTNLSYKPTPTSNTPIIRTSSSDVSIQCFYSRHGNVSSNAIKPTWIPFSSTVSVEERLSFSLQLMNDDWSAPRISTIYSLGDVFNIEASVNSENHVAMNIFVDSCMATLTTDVNSNPRYEIIASNGCLVDGKQVDANSTFRSPRQHPDKIQFTVDAFMFSRMDSAIIYITCTLKAAALTQVPNATSKACSFSKTTNVWYPLEGPSEICSCCDTGNCIPEEQGRRWIPYYTGSRRQRKREAMSGPYNEQGEAVATLGPLLIVGSEGPTALSSSETDQMVEIWVLVGAGVFCGIVAFACLAINWKYFSNISFKI